MKDFLAAAAPGRQPARRAELVPRAAAAGGRRAGAGAPGRRPAGARRRAARRAGGGAARRRRRAARGGARAGRDAARARSTPRPATGPLEPSACEGLRAGARAAASRRATPTPRCGSRTSISSRRRAWPRATCVRFAAELAIDPPSSSADLARPPHLDEEYLVLSTVHSAKGLEWDAVHVLALSDGLFPSRHGADEPRGRWRRSAGCSTSR